VRGSVGVEDVEGSTAAVENTPDIAFLEVVFLGEGVAFFDFLGYIFEGILEDEIHLVVN
jgi:hypothetical protein